MAKGKADKILIIGPSWVGDMVMAQTLFMTLKRHRPDCVIDVLAPAWSQPLLDRMPQVRKGIPMPVGHGELKLGIRRKLAGHLREEQYRQAIVLPNSFKSALIPWMAKIPLRTGWQGELRYGLLNDRRTLDKERYPLMVERFIALGLPKGEPMPAQLPHPALQTTPANVLFVRKHFSLNDDRPVLILCPGAEFGEAKRWPAPHYASIARQRIEEGWQVWLMGSENDRQVTAQIKSATGNEHAAYCHDLAGKTSLSEAIDLLSLGDAVVSNDSGLMHIAAALNRPLVAIYGSTSPAFTPPLNDQARLITSDLKCAPCFKRTCRFGHNHCLVEQQPGNVLAELHKLTRQSLAQP
ncbi:MAG: lipopolysaccharide heptosyltransferase II [Pseudomonadales bacterium]|nr:lipopolysaccharide heptosyltransferase II [Pseudomonadales bacterium]